MEYLAEYISSHSKEWEELQWDYPDYKHIAKKLKKKFDKLKNSVIYKFTSGEKIIEELQADKQLFTIQ